MRSRIPPQAWLNLRGLHDPDRFDAWLHRLLVRACYRRPAASSRDRRAQTASTVEAATSTNAFGRSFDQLDRSFRRLSPEQRAVIVLHYPVCRWSSRLRCWRSRSERCSRG
jgi:DNA-directed RNA polymerase specialized sigma24 family protein